MAKTVKEFILNTRADLKKSVKLEIVSAICLAAGAILWYLTTPLFLIGLSNIFGPTHLVMITTIISVMIFMLLAGALALLVMDLLLHYLRGRQLDEIIYGLAAQQAQAEAPPPPPPPPPARPVQKKSVQRPPQQGPGAQPPPQRDVSQQRRSIIQRKPGR